MQGFNLISSDKQSFSHFDGHNTTLKLSISKASWSNLVNVELRLYSHGQRHLGISPICHDRAKRPIRSPARAFQGAHWPTTLSAGHAHVVRQSPGFVRENTKFAEPIHGRVDDTWPVRQRRVCCVYGAYRSAVKSIWQRCSKTAYWRVLISRGLNIKRGTELIQFYFHKSVFIINWHDGDDQQWKDICSSLCDTFTCTRGMRCCRWVNLVLSVMMIMGMYMVCSYTVRFHQLANVNSSSLIS